jgi:Tol biopolymer transport system component
MKRICIWTIVVGVAGLFGVTAPAQATFPGANGKIAFQGCGTPDCGIFAINPDGTGRTQITHGTITGVGGHGIPFFIADSAPAWSPDGKRIVFVGERPDAQGEIRIANADGTGDTGLGFHGGDPVFSPDGTKLAFDAFSNTNGNFIDGIGTIGIDGSGLVPLTAPGEGRVPDWAANGKIAFSGNGKVGDASPQLYSMNADGSNQTQLTFAFLDTHGQSSFSPSWSPDGTKLAFVFTFLGSPGEIYSMNADGTGKTNLTNDPSSNDQEPVWSPDGSKIAYENRSNGQIMVMNADGTDKHELGLGGTASWQPIPLAPPCTNKHGKPKKPHGHNCK